MRWPAQRVIACGMHMHAAEDIQHPLGQTAAAASEAARLRKPKKREVCLAEGGPKLLLTCAFTPEAASVQAQQRLRIMPLT